MDSAETGRYAFKCPVVASGDDCAAAEVERRGTRAHASLFGLSDPDGTMTFLIGFAAAHPRSVLMAVTVLAAFLVPQLELRISGQAMMAEGGPGRAQYEETIRNFASSNAVVVVLHDARLFTPQTLAAVRSVVDDLGGLAFVEGIDSLFTLR
jgi:hypothetical protein